MVIRKQSKKRRYLGTRTRGAGDTKNRRGSGCRGGTGRAGAFRHKFSKYFDEEKEFKLKPATTELAVSICKLNEYVENLLENNKIKKTDLEKGIEIDFSENKVFKKYSKIIGRSEPKFKFILKNVKATETVKGKVENKGGTLE